MKKAFFIILALALMVESFSFNAYAEIVEPGLTQRNVSDLEIVNNPDNTSMDTYSITLNWTQPFMGVVDTGSDFGPNLATDFNISYQNMTSGTPKVTVKKPADENGDGIIEGETYPFKHRFDNLALESDSLYEFIVAPVHDNSRYTYDADGNRNGSTSYPAPIEPYPAEQRGLFLTNMTITGTGEGNRLTFRWKNPTFNGKDLFDGFNLYYQEDDGSERRIDSEPIPLAMSELTKLPGGVLEYTITDNDLKPGLFYAAKIEPRYEGKPVRGREDRRLYPPISEITLTDNGLTYSVDYKPFDKVEYRNSDEIYINPSLEISYEGQDYVKLIWGNLYGLVSRGIKTIDIYESENPDEIGEDGQPVDGLAPAVTIDFTIIPPGNESEIQNMQDILRPHYGRTWYYKIKYTLRRAGGVEEIMWTKRAVAVPSDSDFTAYSPDIKMLADPIPGDTTAALTVKWLAFYRKIYKEEERNPKVETDYGLPDMTVDIGINYEIYVTDDFANFNNPSFLDNPQVIPITYKANEGFEIFPPDNPDGTPIDPAVRRVPVYSYSIPRYFTSTAPGQFEPRQLEGNKVYYVMIVASHDPDLGQRPKQAYASVFLPPIGSEPHQPLIMDAPPLSVKSTTADSITIHWPKRFIQIYNNADKQWYSVVGVNNSGGVVFGREAQILSKQGIDGRAFVINDLLNANEYEEFLEMGLTDPMAVDQFLHGTGGITDRLKEKLPAIASQPVTARVIDLGNAAYEVHVVDFDTMMEAGGYEAYRTTKINTWRTITPTVLDSPVNNRDMEYPEVGPPPLLPNTTYVIYMRPFESITEQRAYLPNYTVGITEDIKEPLEVDPTTPVLFPDPSKTTYNSLTVYWENQGIDSTPPFSYYLFYSDTLGGEGEPLSWDSIKGDIFKGRGQGDKASDGKEYLYYTIKGLFPDTTYYIWAQSEVANPSGPTRSELSNAIDMKTKDIDAPPPPGLGVASDYILYEYNRANGTSYSQNEPDALNVTTTRNNNDTGPVATSGAFTSLGNINGNAELLPLAIAQTFYVTRFSGLEPNNDYRLRAKTVFNVSRNGAAVTETYGYVIQASLDEDYESYLQFAIPSYTPVTELDSFNSKQKESAWVEITLGTAEGDGFGEDIDPERYPLPEQDFEITYDPATAKYKLRFRTGLVDADGIKDQQADQRFISRLVTDRTSTYTVDLSHYQNRPILVRELELPYTIMQAFDQRKITLLMKAGDYDLSVPPGSFNTAQVRNLQPGVGSNINLVLNGAPSGLPTLKSGESFSADPQNLSARLTTPTRTVTLDSFAKPLSVVLPMDGHMSPEDITTRLSYSTPDTGAWQTLPGQYSYTDNSLTAPVSRPGSFAGIIRGTPDAVVPAAMDVSHDAMRRVTNRLSFTDMDAYNASETVNVNNFNNVIAAVALNRDTVTLGGNLSAADRNSLTKASLYNNGTLTREAAMSTLVKLYELKTRRVMTPMTTAETLPGIEYASSKYRSSLLKAADLGFIAGDLNPAYPLTMGDLMTMLDILMTDTD